MVKIADVLKYEGENGVFVFKHPNEDFNSLTQLIVHESQEAVFYLNGEALDSFGPGRYTLTTENIPLLGKVLNRVTGDKSPFHAEVYFINKAEQMAIKWGTDSRIHMIEPAFNFPITLGACGEMSLKVEDARLLLIKVVGTEKVLTQEGISQKFRAFLMTRVKSYLAGIIKERKISVFEIEENLNEISSALLSLIKTDFLSYGVSLERFFVTTVSRPDGEAQYEKFKSLYFRQYADVTEAKIRQEVQVIEAETEAKRTVIESQAIAQKRAQEGYTYQQERGFDVAEKVASNEAVGQYTNMGVGIGAMAGVGGAVAGTVGGTVKAALSDAEPTSAISAGKCANCGATLPANAKFCPECGQKQQAVCPECGKSIPVGAKFCPECGKKL
ncbi:MAG: SPFH domain-containing protein [Clostridia bacterium]|nr:SPFH domain-containing protein [Clostridia bacterium]